MRSPNGASTALIACLEKGAGTLLLSVALVLEYEAICQLAEHRIVAGLSSKDVSAAINALLEFAEPVEIHHHWRPQLRDPGDEMVLEAAVNGRADYLVTFNQRDFGVAPSRFGIKVLSPSEALKRIRKIII